MLTEEDRLVSKIVQAVLEEMSRTKIEDGAKGLSPQEDQANRVLEFEEKELRQIIGIENAFNARQLKRIHEATPARVAIGRAGSRLKTNTQLLMRADHAAAHDAVFLDLEEAFLKKLELFSVQTQCPDSDTFVTRPDLGRKLSEEAKETILTNCIKGPDIQIYISDGLSSAAVEANAANILPAILNGLKVNGLTAGSPFYLRFGRVAAMDEVSELLDAKITCVLLGERPGLLTAESMSAYVAYRAQVGMPESRRTVISNIHANGTPAVEAGAYIADLLKTMLECEASGVELRKKVESQ